MIYNDFGGQTYSSHMNSGGNMSINDENNKSDYYWKSLTSGDLHSSFDSLMNSREIS